MWRLALLIALCLAQPAHAAPPAASGGLRHALAVHADGTVRAWGADDSGQLGLGRVLYFESPRQVDTPARFSAVSAGFSHVLALTSAGEVWAWGDNVTGQLGDGTRTGRGTASPVPGLPAIRAVSAGRAHSLALAADGSVWAWGSNSRGESGDRDISTNLRLTPQVLTGLPPVRTVIAGFARSFAIAQDGTLWSWGDNADGNLGDGTTQNRAAPRVVQGLPEIVAFADGARHSVALDRAGAVWTWGANDYGQLGSGNFIARATPERVPALGNVIDVSAGLAQTVLLRADGTVWGFGYNGGGELGEPDVGSISVVPTRARGLTEVAAISTNGRHSVALRRDGSVWTWGDNQFCESAACGEAVQATPLVRSGAGTSRAASAGAYFNVTLRDDGRVWAWGDNSSGQLGDDATTLASTPQVLPSLPGIVAVATGIFHSIALRADGRVLGWGSNLFGQATGDAPVPMSSPQVVAGVQDVTAIAAAEYHTVVLRSDGTVWAWGLNSDGQIASGGLGTILAPMPVEGIADAIAIAAGSRQSAALKRDGTVWTWGSAYAGADTGVQQLRPQRVEGLDDVVALSVSVHYGIALKRDGSVWTWGRNNYGQLGDGTTTDRLAPAPVGGLPPMADVKAGGTFALALARDGRVWAWGRNLVGELGDGTAIDRAVPAPVPGAENIAAINAGVSFSLAIRRDATLYGWGENYSGNLGDGTLAVRRAAVVALRERGGGEIETANWFLDLDPAQPKAIAPERIPVFSAVTSSQQGSVDVLLKARAADVGSARSVFVFALAPASIVKGAAAEPGAHFGMKTRVEGKDTAVACVLSQLNAAGQLVAVSAANLQAFISGVLNAQGQSVNILSGVPAINIGGATFYVGYGPNGSAMMTSGTNRSVVSVPGGAQCQPQAPKTGWWWNPAEDGRGFSIEKRGNNLFFASFLYDVTGRSTWYVSTGPVSLDGSLYAGDLLSARGGQTLGGAYPGFPTLRNEGPITLAFNTASEGLMSWPGGTVPIQRFNIVPNGLTAPPVAGTPESGWWWNEQESGRGFFMEWQGGTLDIAGYMYDDAGNPVWYLTVGEMAADGRSLSGNWWSYGNGQTLTGAWRPNTRLSTNVAPVTIQFSGPDTALMTLPNGRSTTLRRHRF